MLALCAGDRFNKDGQLSLTETRNCLTGTPYEKFGHWLTTSGRFGSFDQNKDGLLSKQELGPALEAYMNEAFADIDLDTPEKAREVRNHNHNPDTSPHSNPNPGPSTILTFSSF